MSKQRADTLLVAQGLVESRSLAQRMVMAGQVRADGQVVAKPSTLLAPDVTLEVESPPRYVSRGGFKLEAALEAFALDVQGFLCADLGSSTGGFTDCLLQCGAEKVFAIDVGRGQLHWKLRQDARVFVMEGTNARKLKSLPEVVDLVTIDASFISLRVLLPVVKSWLKEKGKVIALVKPQFEAGRAEASRGKGVIRDPEIHERVLLDVLRFAEEEAYVVENLMPSPIVGPKGNVEFLALLAPGERSQGKIPALVKTALQEAARIIQGRK